MADSTQITIHEATRDDAASFMREDYRSAAELLRACRTSRWRMEFYCSNNLNIILAALDKAGAV